MNTDQIKLRLEDAGSTILMLPMQANGMPRGSRSLWPEIARTYQEWFTAQVMADQDHREEMLAGRNAVRVRPMQKQIDDLDEVLAWIWHIKDGKRRRIVTLRSLRHPVSGRYLYGWRRLGRELGLHENTIRYHYELGIDEIRRGITNCRLGLQDLVHTA